MDHVVFTLENGADLVKSSSASLADSNRFCSLYMTEG